MTTNSSVLRIVQLSEIQRIREEAIMHIEALIVDRLEEVAIMQEQLTLLSKNHVQESSVTDPYGDKGKYTGRLTNGKPHGKGIMKYEDGRVYVGTLCTRFSCWFMQNYGRNVSLSLSYATLCGH